jgi:hypothetical protein
MISENKKSEEESAEAASKATALRAEVSVTSLLTSDY